MKRKSVLNKQSVKRKQPKKVSKIWGMMRLVGSLSFKISIFLVGMVSISVLFLTLYQYLISSPHIRLEEVVFTDVDEDIKREIVEMARLNTDMSLLTINLHEIKERVERHPWIRSVEMEKRFPHTLIIQVEKEQPQALVALDKLAYMNRFGKIFKELGEMDETDYPVVTGVIKAGAGQDTQLRLAAQVLKLFESGKGAWSPEELAEIHVGENGELSLYSISIPAVIRINGRELDAKNGELKKIVKHLKKTGRIHTVKAIDMNYRNGAVVSFNKG
ncbi:MAG: FtsQ-type POTRA domain-containing protein [Deltaproteobacteria bacterium]|nr:FtsQ-type POTRA domain-containing protein [Deltaproteobacteria bacterium]MBW1912331.1 FtsQ-type POTRA domain-containing protein [Deltaproteobacteria bacterium]